MGTRANVGILLPDNQILSIYTHWDGYVSHHGSILLEHYNTKEKVEELLKEGYISSLGERCDKPEAHSYDTPIKGYTVYYGRDRQEDWDDIKPKIVSKGKFHQQEFAYYFDPNKNCWYWKHHDKKAYKKLTTKDTEKG